MRVFYYDVNYEQYLLTFKSEQRNYVQAFLIAQVHDNE